MLNLINGSDVLAGHDLFDLQDRMRRLFEPFQYWAGRRATDDQESAPGAWYPRMDVVEDAEAYRIYAELPGVSADRVSITVENNTLTIRGEKPEVAVNDVRMLRSERAFGAFERAFTLPSTADPESVTATYRDGMLIVALQKTQRAMARQIPVSTS